MSRTTSRFRWWECARVRAGAEGRSPRGNRHRLRPGLLDLEDRRLLSNFTVTSTADDGSTGTLRWALDQANSASGTQAIDFSSLFNTPQTITLSGKLGTLALKNASGITIDGPSAGLTISGGGSGGSGQVISSYTGATSTISDVTITGGTGDRGGALNSLGGTLNLNNCTVAGNTATGYGGGLYAFGGNINLTNCTFTNNVAGSGFYGGAIFNEGSHVSLVNCTVSGNTAAFGGGLYDEESGLIYGHSTLQGTIVAGNIATDAHGGPNLWGNDQKTEFISDGYNLIGSNPDGALVTQNGTDQLNKDPLLSALGYYGGPTPTMALLPTSPAIGKGPGVVDQDQRGFPLDSPPDVGAFQVQSGPIVVNTTSDGITSQPGQMSLRQALNLANVLHTAATITFDQSAAGAFSTSQTITLELGELDLTDTGGTQTFTGPTGGVTVSGGGKNRVFEVEGGVTAAITGLTITGGAAPGAGGGGLLNLDAANLTLTDCTFSGNTAVSGGGLANYGTVALTDCTISKNISQTDGGGFASDDSDGGGGAILTDCTVSMNTASNFGGGLFLHGAIQLSACTISGNKATGDGGGLAIPGGGDASLSSCTVSGNTSSAAGGGLAIDGTASLTNCTVSGNTAGSAGGGGLANGGLTTLTDCTVSGNAAGGAGGGLANDGTAKLSNTIDAVNTASVGPDADGAVLSQGFNLIGITDGSSGWVTSDLTGTGSSPLNPLLAALGNYGGPTQTMALLPGSPAIDAGNSSVATDQRGVSRPKGSAGDIGAFESSGFTITVASGSGQSANITEPFASPVVVTITPNNLVEPVVGGQVDWSAPESGASAALSVKVATIGSAGTASTLPTADLTPGTYTVTATAKARRRSCHSPSRTWRRSSSIRRAMPLTPPRG